MSGPALFAGQASTRRVSLCSSDVSAAASATRRLSRRREVRTPCQEGDGGRQQTLRASSVQRPWLGPNTLRSVVILVFAVWFCAGAAEARRGKGKKGKKPAGLMGMVLNQQGLPVADVQVSAARDGEVVAEVRSDAKGRFQLDLETGRGSYVVRLERPGYRSYEATYALERGVRQEVEVRLWDEAADSRRQGAEAYNTGLEAYQQESWASARQHFEEATRLDPELAQAWLGLADVLERLDELDAAAAAIASYLELRPNEPQAMLLAQRIASRRGDSEAEAEILDRVQDDQAASTVLAVDLYNEGVLAGRRGDDERALERFARALELNPDLAEAHLSRATLLYNRHDMVAAEGAVQRLLELQPDNLTGRRLRVLVLVELQSEEILGSEVVSAMEHLAELAPEEAASLLQAQAEQAFRLGELAPARESLLKVIEWQPGLAKAYYTLGLCFSAEDRPVEARQQLQRFLELAPNDPDARAAREMLSYL